ncbi:unnamed protein product, partial [Mesorhabditis belari]|uniref:Golgi SNAP receptor complex member 2 n=1 Tax=Mesorhabditis belari TaxID=2138241 RepID=A0AAF3EYR8_9BILA
MERLYHETNNLLQQVYPNLSRLERAKDQNEAEFEMQSLQSQLREIDTNCDRLDMFVSKEIPQKRPTAKMKVDQLKADCQRTHMALNAMYAKLMTRWKVVAEREELLKQRIVRSGDSTAVTMNDHELLVNDRLQHSHRGVDDLLNQGVEVLSSLRNQHLNLRGVRRKMFDIGAQLGLSDTTMRMIEKRTKEDWHIFLILSILFCIFMYAFYRFWKG